MEMVIRNPQKGQLETIKVTINEANTTWFDDCFKVVICDVLIVVLRKSNNQPVFLEISLNNVTLQSNILHILEINNARRQTSWSRS